MSEEQARGQISERTITGADGPVMAGVAFAAVLVGAALVIVGGILTKAGASAAIALIVLGALAVLAGGFVSLGLTPVAPGYARVVQLFGRYVGTVRVSGLRWVNPLTTRQIVSTRVRNYQTDVTKVNDGDGNPIEIAVVVVWQVEDTARAVYDVEDFEVFVDIQAETAVRHIAASYPYNAHGGDQLSLRDNAEEITERLSAEIADRVRTAGVRIIESRLTQLSYAPEIAQAMLRRQQAGAVVEARQRIVEGAVGMVELALQRLDEQNVIELDEERKATMVSNLLVVLCSDQATQPVVNTGSLYH